MIPKIIHYVWVGDDKKPELVKKCIASWQQHCPDYQIMQWGNSSLKDITNAYVQQAFACKKWAFVSDYLRLYALKNFGGVYCDSDLEITNNIDQFLRDDFLTGYENYRGVISPMTALMAASENNDIISDLLSEYDNINFFVDGKMDLTTNVTRTASYFANRFALNEPYNGENITILKDKAILYPYYYFCTATSGKVNFAIHHFSGSWVEHYRREDVFSFLGYSFIKIKILQPFTNKPLPLATNEKVIFTLKNNKKSKYFIIKK
jgi:hypothetical protein